MKRDTLSLSKRTTYKGGKVKETDSLQRLIEEREGLKGSSPVIISGGENLFKNHKMSVLSLVQCSIPTDMWDEKAFEYFDKAFDIELKILEHKNIKFKSAHCEINVDRAKNRIHVSHLWKYRSIIIGAIQSVIVDMTGQSTKIFTKKTVKVRIDFSEIDSSKYKFIGAIIFSESGDTRLQSGGSMFVRNFFVCNRNFNTDCGIKTSGLTKELKSLNESINITWDRNINVMFYAVKDYYRKGEIVTPQVDGIIWSASMVGNIRQPIVKEGLLIQRHDNVIDVVFDVFKNLSRDRLNNVKDRRHGDSLVDQLMRDFEILVSAKYYDENPEELTEDAHFQIYYKKIDRSSNRAPQDRKEKKSRAKKDEDYTMTAPIGEIIKSSKPTEEIEEDEDEEDFDSLFEDD